MTPRGLQPAIRHFAQQGWAVVDALSPDEQADLGAWVDEVAALPDGHGGVLQHFEGTDEGLLLCRSENFVPVHDRLRRLLCAGAMLEVAGALMGEPAVLYKEKVNHKLPGGAGSSAHQDASAYPMIDAHVSAMVAVDGADEGNGGLEIVTGCFDTLLPTDARGCIDPAIAAGLDWRPVPLPAGQTLWFHSRTPHRSGANRSDRPRRARYPTYNAAREGDRRAAYYEAKRVAIAATSSPNDRARVSLIGDCEGRPVWGGRREGRLHGARQPRPRRWRGTGPRPRGDDVGDVSEPSDVRDRRGAPRPRHRDDVVCGDGAIAARAWLPGIDGIEGTAPFHLTDTRLECCLVWADPGRAFGFADEATELGTHGGPRNRTQVAVVTGGHFVVPTLGAALQSRPVGASDWAPTIAEVLGLDLPTATGRSLLH